MQRNEQLQRLASKVAASWTARASALDARDVFAEFVELRPALAENVDEGLRREVRNGEAAIRDYLTTLIEDPAVAAEIERLDAADSSIAVAPADVGQVEETARTAAEGLDGKRGLPVDTAYPWRGGFAWHRSGPGPSDGRGAASQGSSWPGIISVAAVLLCHQVRRLEFENEELRRASKAKSEKIATLKAALDAASWPPN